MLQVIPKLLQILFSLMLFSPAFGQVSPVPDTLREGLGFSAQRVGTKVEIGWNCANGEQTDHFVLERFRSGYDWEPLKRIDAPRSTVLNSSYRYVDEPLNENIYYRLVQVGHDGGFETFGPIYVGPLSQEPLSFHAYPNPAIDRITIDNIGRYPYQLEIWSIGGTRCEVLTVHSSCQTINVGHLLPGNYILTDASRCRSQVIRIVR